MGQDPYPILLVCQEAINASLQYNDLKARHHQDVVVVSCRMRKWEWDPERCWTMESKTLVKMRSLNQLLEALRVSVNRGDQITHFLIMTNYGPFHRIPLLKQCGASKTSISSGAICRRYLEPMISLFEVGMRHLPSTHRF